MNYQDIKEKYEEYSKKIGNRKSLYKKIVKRFNVGSALYPGSHIDIAPSIVIPKVTYIDNFKGAIKYFKEIEPIVEYVNTLKEYDESCKIIFIGEDYSKDFDIEPVDLIISQYAGFVGQATKEYLKKGGILLCNDSHGDATLANFDNDFTLIGVIKNYKIVESNLNKYFKLPNNKENDLKQVKAKMKGPKYNVMAENYIFKKK
jgi:hypothetical protein